MTALDKRDAGPWLPILPGQDKVASTDTWGF